MEFNHRFAKKKQWIIATVVMAGSVGVLMLGLWVSDPNKGKPDVREQRLAEEREVKESFKARTMDAVTPKERWIAASEKELANYKSENKSIRQDQAELQEKLRNLEALIKSGELNRGQFDNLSASGHQATLPPPPPFKTGEVPLVSPAKEVNTLPGNKNDAYIGPPSKPLTKGNKTDNTVSSIQVYDFDDESSSRGAASKSNNISHYLPAGTFAKVALLSGADAPTGGEAKNNPVPVFMRLMDYGTLPNYFSSDIEDCLVTGAMRGDLASERGKIRTEKLSCVLVNGDVVEANIKGWIIGEDGKEGFRGTVVEKSGVLIARTFAAGALSGLGNTISQSFSTVSTNPNGSVSTIDPSNIGKAGLSSGLSNSMEKLADYYMERANEMYPIIEVSANRRGELVLQEGIDLKRNFVGNMGGE